MKDFPQMKTQEDVDRAALRRALVSLFWYAAGCVTMVIALFAGFIWGSIS